MSDRKYNDLDTENKLRVNAVIFSALKQDEPKGITQTMRERLAGGLEPTALNIITGGLISSKEQDRQKDFEIGQKFLNRMRDTLAALPMDGDAPAIPKLGDIKNKDASLEAQQEAFKRIISSMIEPAKPGEKKLEAPVVSKLIEPLSDKLVHQGNVNDLPMVKLELTKFRAVEEVAICKENAKNVPTCPQPPVQQQGKGR